MGHIKVELLGEMEVYCVHFHQMPQLETALQNELCHCNMSRRGNHVKGKVVILVRVLNTQWHPANQLSIELFWSC